MQKNILGMKRYAKTFYVWKHLDEGWPKTFRQHLSQLGKVIFLTFLEPTERTCYFWSKIVLPIKLVFQTDFLLVKVTQILIFRQQIHLPKITSSSTKSEFRTNFVLSGPIGLIKEKFVTRDDLHIGKFVAEFLPPK